MTIGMRFSHNSQLKNIIHKLFFKQILIEKQKNKKNKTKPDTKNRCRCSSCKHFVR